MDDNKWTLSIGATYKNEEISPELKIKDQIDEDSKMELTLSKDKVYASYELKF